MTKRSKTDLSAVIAVDKPAGITSHDVVSRLRRITGERRIGHAGTLDPFATGVLIVCIGPATRLSDLAMSQEKEYVARIVFGARTDTDDCTGELLECGECPDELMDEAYARSVLESFTGTFEQLPPQYSAKKLGGRKAYELARAGKMAEVRPVEVTVFRSELLATGRAEGGENDGRTFWDVRFTVSKGTYIRSLARDIGARCGSFAHLSSLRRTRSGSVSADDCLDLAALEEGFTSELLAMVCLDPVALIALPSVEADESMMARVSNGAPLAPEEDVGPGEKVAIVHKGRLHALYEADASGELRCKTMIPGGVSGACGPYATGGM